MIEKLLVALLLVSVSLQSQYVPFTKKLVGVPFGNPSGQIYIELIYDPVCMQYSTQVTTRETSM